MLKLVRKIARRAVAASSICMATMMLTAPVYAADPVRVNLAWLPQGSTGGILLAQAKGY